MASEHRGSFAGAKRIWSGDVFHICHKLARDDCREYESSTLAIPASSGNLPPDSIRLHWSYAATRRVSRAPPAERNEARCVGTRSTSDSTICSLCFKLGRKPRPFRCRKRGLHRLPRNFSTPVCKWACRGQVPRAGNRAIDWQDTLLAVCSGCCWVFIRFVRMASRTRTTGVPFRSRRHARTDGRNSSRRNKLVAWHAPFCGSGPL